MCHAVKRRDRQHRPSHRGRDNRNQQGVQADPLQAVRHRFIAQPDIRNSHLHVFQFDFPQQLQ